MARGAAIKEALVHPVTIVAIWVLAIASFAFTCTACNTVASLLQPQTVVEMTDDEFTEWTTASTQEVASYAAAAMYEGDLDWKDLKRFTEELDKGIWGVVKANGYKGLALQQLLFNYRQTLADKGIDPIHATARFSQYTKALSKELKALLPQTNPA